MSILDPKPLLPGALDAKTTDLINGTGTATRGALDATILEQTEPIASDVAGLIRTQISRGGVAAIGDSITAWGSASQTQHGDVWWNLLGIKTNQRIRFDAFYATAGHTMEQIETDHLPSVLAMNPKPGACFIFAGTNNMGGAFNIATLAATHKRITDALVDAGIVPVLCTIPPRNSPTTAVSQVAQWNAYIRGKASQNGFPLLDVNAALIDPATGGFLAGLGETDQIHPNYAGHGAIATLGAASTALVNRFPDAAPYLARSVSDAANLLGDQGMFVADSNADGVSDGWTGINLPDNATPSIVVDSEGRWQRLAKINAQAGTAYVFRDITLLGSSVSGLTVTALTDTFSKTAHGLVAGEVIRFTTAVAGLATGTNYYIRDATADTFKVSSTKGGAVRDLTADGTVTATRVNYEEGDKFQFAGRVRFNTVGSSNQAVLQVVMMGVNITYDSRTINGVDGIEYVSGTVPAGTTSMRVNLMLTGTAAGNVNADFKQVTFVNLTKLGL